MVIKDNKESISYNEMLANCIKLYLEVYDQRIKEIREMAGLDKDDTKE